MAGDGDVRVQHAVGGDQHTVHSARRFETKGFGAVCVDGSFRGDLWFLVEGCSGHTRSVSVVGWLVTGTAPLGVALLFVPRELWKRWRGRLVDRLDTSVRRRVSRFDRRYREFILGGLRFIDLKGLATVGFHTPELDEVYVDVSLARRPPHQVPDDMLARLPAAVSERQSVDDFLDRPQPVVLAVIGAPGSGKTTLLRHTARRICRDRRGRRRTVPIVLYLRDQIEAIGAGAGLPGLVRGTLGRYAEAEPPKWLEQRLTEGTCVVLLDGLDEVSRPQERRMVADWVEYQARQYPGNDYVITSRPQGYRSASINGATVVQVRNFTDEQVTRFVRGWYAAVQKRSESAVTEGALASTDEAADDLLKRLNLAPGLYDLTVNPLLLTMIANVHHYRGALPGSRADLYNEICQVMLWRRQVAKKLPADLAGEKKETLLRGLAFSMMRSRVRDLPRDEVLAEFKVALRRMSEHLPEEEFLAESCRYGLLMERESGVYSFAHLTFQEALAAAHIRAKRLVGVLVKAVDDPWWRETTLLYASQSDADPIVQACLEAGSVTALSLAFDCAEQSNDLAPELRDALRNLLESEEDDRRRTAVLATRHLRDVVGGVCARPITYELYQLFLEKTGNPRPDGIDAGGNEPVTGVRGTDATAFVQWVNQVIGDSSGYRLPDHEDVEHPAVRRALAPALCAWVGPRVDLWTPDHADHPRLVEAAALTRHVDQDIERAASLIARLLVVRCAVVAGKHARGRRYGGPTVAPGYADTARLSTFAKRIAEDPERRRGLEVAGDLDRALARDLATHHDVDRNLHPVQQAIFSLDHLEKRASNSAGMDFHYTYDEDAYKNADGRAYWAKEAEDAAEDVKGSADDVARGLIYYEVRGRALEHALDAAFAARDQADWHRRFREKFLDLTGCGRFTGIVSLEAMVSQLRAARLELKRLLRPGVTPTEWADKVASGLEDNAVRVFDRTRPLTADLATRTRLAAMCLAAEADAHGGDPIGDTFRGIASGITLMEQRVTGRVAARETIILAKG